MDVMESEQQTVSPRRQSKRLLDRQIDSEVTPRKRQKFLNSKSEPPNNPVENLEAKAAPQVTGEPDQQPFLTTPAPLTRQNLTEFTRTMAGSDPIASTVKDTSEGKTVKTKDSNITTTDPEFGPQLTRNNVRHVNARPAKPIDFEEQREAWKRTRDSPEPDIATHEIFEIEVATKHTENTTLKLWCELRQKPLKRDTDYREYLNVQWSSLKNDVTNRISNAKPDVVEAFTKEAYPRETEDYLRELSPGQYSHVMPSFAVEVKQAMVGLPGADLQCAYDGALMVHSALLAHLQMYGNLDEFYGKTKAITIAFNGDVIEYFLHHATPNLEYRDATDPQFTFHQFRLGKEFVTGDYDDFKKGWRHIRNSQDIGYKLAKDLQSQLQAHCNRLRAAPRAVRPRTASVPSNAPPSPPSEASSAKASSSSNKRARIETTKDIAVEASKTAMSKATNEAVVEANKPTTTASVKSAASRA